MTALSSNKLIEMDFLQPEDTMDIASSPHMPPGDLDLDLDSMHELAFEAEDIMFDNHPDTGEQETEPIQPETIDDDEMIDEDMASHVIPDHLSDLQMNAVQQDSVQVVEDGDEDVLYEDEDLSKDDVFLGESQGITLAQDDNHEVQEISEEVLENPQDLEATYDQINTLVANKGLTRGASGRAIPITDNSGIDVIALPQEDEIQDFEEAQTEQISDRLKSRQPSLSGPQQPPIEAEGGMKNEPTAGHDSLDLATITNTSASSAQVPGLEHTDIDTTKNDTIDEQVHDQHQEHFPNNVAIHPVKVIYQDSEIYLFPLQHDEEETFFLSEINLAHESIDNLLASCREVLADTIGNDDELVLDVASMGLHISEGSKYAAEITLAQILDVYLKLSHNDNLEQVEPLYCSLSSRVCLTSQYAYLTAAAQEGKKFAEIAAEHLGMSEENTPEQQGELEFYSAEELSSLKDPAQMTEAVNDQISNTATEDPRLAQEAGLETDQVDDAYPGDYDEHVEQSDHEEEKAPEDVHPGDGESHEIQVSNDQTDETGKQSTTLQTSAEFEDTAQIGPGIDQDHPDSLEEPGAGSAVAETASSHTVEADHAAEEDTFEQQEELLEDPVDLGADNYNEALETNVDLVEDEQQNYHPEPLNQNNGDDHKPTLEEDDDDLLELEGEDNEQQPTADILPAHDYGEKELTPEDDVQEDLFAEDDVSTDQIITETMGDSVKGHLNGAAPPATPSKDKISKRKIVDDDDEFGLLEIETPDKKRRRPS